jgi:hypothetical protein
VAAYGLKDAACRWAATGLQDDAMGELKLPPMVPMPNVQGSNLADRTDGLIAPQPAKLRRSPDKLFIPGVVKLLFNKSFHQRIRPTAANQHNLPKRSESKAGVGVGVTIGSTNSPTSIRNI